ncbi:hypothetical protein FBEOM_7012 [Fusarium beomiforme]|uniref:Uncharacterized protein n=1 Tax=Fusarium beomiforme TaxID=44412 RepID=A0A9P5DXH3_9HYPO|nr:hypothetical protein FBEOM_7012 [Fusarium beomiforme]
MLRAPGVRPFRSVEIGGKDWVSGVLLPATEDLVHDDDGDDLRDEVCDVDSWDDDGLYGGDVHEVLSRCFRRNTACYRHTTPWHDSGHDGDGDGSGIFGGVSSPYVA